jgi:capsular polysaccharide biosynthesis protein
MSEPRTENASSPSSAAALSTNYLRILREQWFVVALCFLLCVGGGLIGRNLVPTSYHAQADLLISPIDISDNTYVGVNVFRSISSDPTSNVLTLARYLNTPETAAIAKQRLHVSESPDALLNSISVQPLSQTNIVSVEASASTPTLARDTADAFVDATVARRTQEVQTDVNAVIARLQQQIAHSNPKLTGSLAPLQSRLSALRSLLGLPDPTVTVLNRAQTPTVPAKPAASLVVIATALAGLLLGFGAALFIDSVGGKLRREDDLLVRDRLPVLARVPRMSDATLRAYFGGRANLPPSAWEAYRTLRTNILRSPHTTETPVVLVTSAMTGEGKTLTAVNLAVTLAAQNMQVLLVDGDFRRPMIAELLRLRSRPSPATKTCVSSCRRSRTWRKSISSTPRGSSGCSRRCAGWPTSSSSTRRRRPRSRTRCSSHRPPISRSSRSESATRGETGSMRSASRWDSTASQRPVSS